MFRPPVRPVAVLTVLGMITVVAVVFHLAMGSSLWYAPGQIVAELARGPQAEPSTANLVVWSLRMPRVLAALLVGAILGLVGSAFQAQFRNPLAEPYVVGVSSGAALGGVISLLLHLPEPFGTMGLGFVGGMLSLSLVWTLAKREGVVDVQTLLLSGVVIGALLGALMSLGLLMAGQNANQLLFWLMGHFHDATWSQVTALATALALGSAVLLRQTRKLNAVAMGEETAARLGVDVVRVRLVVLTVGTAMTAIAVGAVGIIGFLGLVAPHIARRLLGVDWRWSMVGAGAIGAGLLVLSDLVAMRGLNFLSSTVGLEPPVGLVTAILGAPTILVLLRRAKD